MKLTHTFVLTCAAAALTLLAGCPKTIEIKGPTVYQETLAEVELSPQDSEVAELVAITFDDLDLAPDEVREKRIPARTQELMGKRVRIAGIMHGGVDKPKGLEMFILLRNQGRGYGPGSHLPDELTQVVMRSGVTADFTTERIEVEGVLGTEPQLVDDGTLVALYVLQDAIVRPVPSKAE